MFRKTGAWFQIEKPSIQVAMNLATHIAAIQPKVSGKGSRFANKNFETLTTEKKQNSAKI